MHEALEAGHDVVASVRAACGNEPFATCRMGVTAQVGSANSPNAQFLHDAMAGRQVASVVSMRACGRRSSLREIRAVRD